MSEIREQKGERGVMYPLNWAGRLLNDCTEIMFRIATNDVVRSLEEIKEAKETLDSLEKCIKGYAYQKNGSIR